MSKSELILKDDYQNLKGKYITIVGAGGTGSGIIELLARMSLPLVIIDADIVDESNLERQTLYTKSDVGKPKVVCAKNKLDMFSNIIPHQCYLTNKNLSSLHNPDLIIDCTDNMHTRFLLNDYCKKENIPLLYTAAIGRIGALYLVNNNRYGQFTESHEINIQTAKGDVPYGERQQSKNGGKLEARHNPKSQKTACLRCFMDEKSGDLCNDAGVLNSTTSLISSLAVSMVTDFLAKNKVHPLIRINLDTLNFEKLNIKQNPKCPTCNKQYDYLNGKALDCIPCISGKYRFFLNKNIDLISLHKALSKHHDLRLNSYSLSTGEITVYKDGRVVIHADSEQQARKLLNENIGG
ncbi:hypothetical protein COV16_07540 [Candidatus Woesearchaeota archaeon CG10_big_fil_rev_8_21_14_0_10_34_8]|nr:MAG: hypothetical protein COV16_07540 [Candidatus Woesearchaeota archaeon CG10_big_fil_rev_8_21_14_0_10_34_8]